MFNKKLLALALVAPVALAVSQAMAADTVANGSNTATSTAKIIRPVTVAAGGTLAFGTIVRPASGSNTVVVSNTGARSITGAGGAVALGSTSSSNASFTISGEGGQSISVTVPASFNLTNTTGSGAETLAVTTTNTMTGSAAAQALDNALGTAGSLTVDVGGSFPISDTTASGTYSGSFTVSASYN